MKIAWIAKHTINEIPTGGAEITDTFWIKTAPKHEIEIDVFTLPEFEQSQRQVKPDYDLVILSNIYDLEIEGCPYIIIHHNSHDMPGHFISVWENAKGVMFMSPDHHLHIDKPYKRHDFSAPFVNFEHFKEDPTIPRRSANLYTGLVTRHKGLDRTLAELPSGEVLHAYGRTDDDAYLLSLESKSNFMYMGKVKQSEIVKVYNNYEKYFWRLDRYGSYGRNLVEAHLCGLQVDVNRENFGLYKFDWDFDDIDNIKENLADELDHFWNKIIKMME